MVTTRYIWQADNEMGHYLIKKIVDKDVEVEYLYGEYVLSNVVYDLGVEIKGKVQRILTWNDELC